MTRSAARPLYRPKDDRDQHLATLKALVAHILAFDGPPQYKREAIDRLCICITHNRSLT